MAVVKVTSSSSSTSFFQRLSTILIYVFFFNLFLFRKEGPVQFALVTFGQFLLLTFTFKTIQDLKKDFRLPLAFLLSFSVYSFGMLFRANPAVQFVMGSLAFLTLLVYAYLLSSNIPMVRSLFELLLAPLYFIGAYVKAIFRTIFLFFTGRLKPKTPEKELSSKSYSFQSLFVGSFLGLFVIGILISMLSSADPVFATFIGKIVSANFLGNLFLRALFSLFIALVLLPFLTLSRGSIFRSPLSSLNKLNFAREMSVIMALVSLVIGLFLVIQWPYVFANVALETDLSQFGVATYSEYVRKGFGELLKVSLFVYGLLWAGLIVLRQKQEQGQSWLKFVQVVVLSEFFIFLFSIFRRVWLYQTYHGWSVVRLYGSVFLFWVLGISLFLALRHFWQKRWVVGEVVFTLVVVFGLAIFNAESFMVLNHPPTVNGKVDYVYLSRLSADGYLGWEKAFEQAESTLSRFSVTGPSLSREEQKEVAYAGLVIRELSRNYHQLFTEYGTKDELKEYLLSVLTFQKKILTVHHASSEGFWLEGVSKVEEGVKDEKVNYQKLMENIEIDNSEDLYQFSKSNYWLENVKSFYLVRYYYDLKYSEEAIKSQGSKLDQLYVWNKPKSTYYKIILEQDKLSALLALQEKYFDLYMKLHKQPLDQTGYDMDISLDSPLIY